MLEPAKTIIEICGGIAETARLSGRDPSRVRRWTYPRDKEGTGGLIPSDVQQDLLLAAHHLGLRPEHFFAVLPVEAAE